MPTCELPCFQCICCYIHQQLKHLVEKASNSSYTSLASLRTREPFGANGGLQNSVISRTVYFFKRGKSEIVFLCNPGSTTRSANQHFILYISLLTGDVLNQSNTIDVNLSQTKWLNFDDQCMGPGRG